MFRVSRLWEVSYCSNLSSVYLNSFLRNDVSKLFYFLGSKVTVCWLKGKIGFAKFLKNVVNVHQNFEKKISSTSINKGIKELDLNFVLAADIVAKKLSGLEVFWDIDGIWSEGAIISDKNS